MRPALRSILRPSTTEPICRACQWRRQQYRLISRTSQRHEKQTFEGYLSDKLNAPLHSPKLQPATRTPPAPPPKDNLPLTQKEETLAKARVVFGSRLSGPDERAKELEAQSTWVAGVLVPPKPEEPDNCCMSGCVNCVWERFREEWEEFAERSAEARRRGTEMRMEGKGTGGMVGEEGAVSMDDDGGGSETNWSVGEEGEVDPMAGIPVGIREFMKTEKKLKKRHRDAGELIETALDKELRADAWAR